MLNVRIKGHYMLFSKKIKVKEEELQEYFCVKHKKSGKKVYLNTELIVPENCVYHQIDTKSSEHNINLLKE